MRVRSKRVFVIATLAVLGLSTVVGVGAPPAQAAGLPLTYTVDAGATITYTNPTSNAPVTSLSTHQLTGSYTLSLADSSPYFGSHLFNVTAAHLADDNGTSFDLEPGANFLACFDTYGTCSPNISLKATNFPVYDPSVTDQTTTTDTTIQSTGLTGPDDPRWVGDELNPSGFTWTASNQYVRGFGMYRNGSQGSLQLVAMIYFTVSVDAAPPAISITTPADGDHYSVGQSVTADYTCSDPSGVASCTGAVPDGTPLDTSTPGTYSFTVTATDNVGKQSSSTSGYTVGTVASVQDAQVAEGDSGSTVIAFPVVLSGPATRPVTVTYSTEDGTATAGSDYVARTGRLTIPAGAVSGTITISVRGDTRVEPDEAFSVSLTAVTPAASTALGRSQASGTIVNDDVSPVVTIADAAAVEGDRGATPLGFLVSLDRPAGAAVKLSYATSDGTATAGSDYNAKSGTVTVPAGATSATIAVGIIGDVTPEAGETFTVTLTGVTSGTATIDRAEAVGTIDDNDSTRTVSVTDSAIAEGDSARSAMAFTVSLDQPVAAAVKVSYSTANGTAAAPGDYVTKSGTVTIAAGSASATINVSIVGDTRREPDETFTVTLTGVTAGPAVIGRAVATGTITDDD